MRGWLQTTGGEGLFSATASGLAVSVGQAMQGIGFCNVFDSLGYATLVE